MGMDDRTLEIDDGALGDTRGISPRTKNILFLATLIGLNLLNYMDRFTVAGTLIDIQNYFKIKDADAGLIVTVFVIFYMLTAPLFGYFGDRYNRKVIICVGLTLWICSVLLSSTSSQFGVFLVSRALVGVGEAAYSTVAPTIIGDLFTDQARSVCLMLFFAALPVGGGLGYVVGASVTSWTSSWQWGLRVTPLIGIIFLAIIVVFFDEPPRGQADQAHIQQTTYLEDLRSISRIKTYVFTTLGCTSVFFVVGSMSWWTPTICEYAWAMQNGNIDVPETIKASIATTFGLLSCFGGLLGVITGPVVSRYWQHGCHIPPNVHVEANPRADPLVCAFGALLAVPTMWMALFTVGKSLAIGYAFIFGSTLLVVLNFAVNTDIILYVTAPNRRATAIAIQTLFGHLLGDATSPLLIGLLSDWIRGGVVRPSDRFTALQYAFYIPNVMLILGAAFYFWAAKYVEKDRERNLIIMHELNPPTILDEDPSDSFVGGVAVRAVGSPPTVHRRDVNVGDGGEENDA